MKKVAIILGLVAFLAVSCDMKEQEPQVSEISDMSFTPCRQTKAAQPNEPSERVDVTFTREGVQITHYNFRVTCDFTTVDVTHTFVNGVLNITQQGAPNQANCICYTDVLYTINGMSQDEVNVIFINGVQVYCYNDKDDENDHSGVYAAIYEFPDRSNSSVPELWKDGKLAHLTNNTGRAYATSVYVSDKDVYIGGCKDAFIPVGNAVYLVSYAVLWKNGALQTIGSDYSNVTSVFVAGDDVYAAGYEYLTVNGGTVKKAAFEPFVPFEPYPIYKYQLPETTATAIKSSSLDAQRQGVATVWKNGVAQYLTDGTNNAWAGSVYVSGSDVFVAGWERNQQGIFVAKLWKNGDTKNLTDGRYEAGANSVYVSDNDVYVAGYEINTKGMSVAKLWKNGVAQNLTDGATLHGWAFSVYVSGDDVYVAGNQMNTQGIQAATLWKNGVAQNLPDSGSLYTQAYSVCVSGNDVYVSGHGQQNTQNACTVAKLWKNGVVQDLTDGSKHGHAYSVFVK